MITKDEAINNIKLILKNEIKTFYRKSHKGRPNALTLDATLDAFFLCFS